MSSIAVTVPAPNDPEPSSEEVRRYLKNELRRYFTGDEPVITFNDDESISARVWLTHHVVLHLICTPGTDDDWFSFRANPLEGL